MESYYGSLLPFRYEKIMIVYYLLNHFCNLDFIKSDAYFNRFKSTPVSIPSLHKAYITLSLHTLPLGLLEYGQPT